MSPPKGEPVFRLRDVCFAYEERRALDGVTLTIEHGEQLALLGANGSGKSTLLRILAALAFPRSGTVHFAGQSLTAERLLIEDEFFAFRRRVGVVFQNPDVQLFNASVREEIAFGPLHLGMTQAVVQERVDAMLASFGLGELRDRAPHRLSGGEKKRLALASVLVTEPQILLLDEPTAALDPKSREEIVELLSSWRGGPRTVVIATHDLDVVDRLADRCCLLQEGRLVGDGEALTLLHDINLLQTAGLIRPHWHQHSGETVKPHPHVHRRAPRS